MWAWFVAGGMGWTVSEYLIHRFVGHGPRREPVRGWRALTLAGLAARFNEEHLAHHANPAYFAATWRKVLAACVAVPLIGGVMTVAFGPARGFAFAVGYAAVYGFYEALHRRIHTRAPLGWYGRWARRHHLAHHHRSPRSNHGVTSPVFDSLIGTELPIGLLVVPRKVAPVWLVDEAGEVRPAHRAEYQLSARTHGAC